MDKLIFVVFGVLYFFYFSSSAATQGLNHIVKKAVAPKIDRFAGNIAMRPAIVYPEPVKKPFDYAAVHIRNRYLSLTFLPGCMGRLSQIRYLPSGDVMLNMFRAFEIVYDPLYKYVIGNNMGYRDLFWGYGALSNSLQPLRLLKDTPPDTISFSAANYGFLQLALLRTTKLPEASTIFEINTKVTSFRRQVLKLQPWYNIVPVADGGKLIIPSHGNISSKHFLKKDDYLIVGIPPSPCYPARNWLAIAYSHKKMIFAYMVDAKLLQPNGWFYFWQGSLVSGEKVKTMETILSDKTLNYGETFTYSCRFGVFPGLSSVKEICGNIAIDCILTDGGGSWDIVLILCPGVNVSAGTLTLGLTPVNCNGENIKLGALKLDDLSVARIKRFHFTVDKKLLKYEKYRICGISPENEKFELLEPLIHRK